MALSKRSTTDVDKLIAARIVMARKAMGMSLENLAAGLGVTFQQVQKYCNASNRVSASRLHMIGSALGVPISFFFEDIDEVAYGKGIAPVVGDAISAKANRLLAYKDVQLILELDNHTWSNVILPMIKVAVRKKGNQRGEESNNKG